MDYKTAMAFSIPVALGIAAFGSAMGLGKAVSSAMDAVARQPEAHGKILLLMAVGCAFIDTITIFVLLVVFSLLK